MNARKTWIGVSGLAVMSLLAVGCASSPKPRLYVFAGPPDRDAAASVSRSVGEETLIIRARHIRLPVYVDRPQIVSRVSAGELTADEFNRWGIPLSALVSKQLSLTIMSELPDAYVDIHPWKGQEDTDYLVELNIVRLDGKIGGSAVLEAQWSVARGDSIDLPRILRLARYERPAADDSIPAYVEAIRQAVEDMAKDIASAVSEDRK